MIKFLNFKYFFIALALSCFSGAYGVNKYFEIPLNEEVGSTSWRLFQSGIKAAEKAEAKAIILHINTYGGTLEHGDSIRTAILNCKLPVYAFIDNNAASAGALIAIACDSIYMRPGASIGAATVVNANGEVMPDKYQSYMRSIIRATAEAHGKVHRPNTSTGDSIQWFRNPIIAEAMVDQRTIVPEIGDDSTRVVTFTSQEAIRHHFSEGEASSSKEIITKYLKQDKYELSSYEPTFWDIIIGFLTNPALQAILIMIIIGGIFFELQTPGMGFPSAAAIIAAIIYFMPLYIEGVAESWEILIFVIGVILLIFEIFVIPGFGVAGISGIILVILSLFCALTDNLIFNFDFISSHYIYISMLTVMAGIILGAILILYISHKIGSKKGFMRNSALELEQNVEDGYIGVPQDLAQYIGKTGISLTVLRPAGKIVIDDKTLDAVSQNEFIEPNTSVKVIKYENTQLYVVAVK
ncbi:MAG: NfeD family protein [Muribaculaceae bacterium]